jgi:LysM repeat protein
MENKVNFPQRYAGYVVLGLIAIALLVFWRIGVSAEEGESGVTAVSTTAIVTPTPELVVIEQDTAVDDSELKEPLPIISDKGLSPNPVPQTFQGKLPNHQFETYIVKRGDAPASIAFQFGIQPETLLGGNAFLSQEASLLQPEMELLIMSIDGVLHDVQSGDSLEGISAQYGIPVEDIIAYEANNLEFPYRLYPDTQIVVPGAVRAVEFWQPPALSAVRGAGSNGIAPLVVGTGTFIFPVGSRNFTQRYWYGHPGIDIALTEGSAVIASDTGTVTFAGWNAYGYGYLIVVNHGNGYETFYGHLSGINVGPGQVVNQGQIIGATGNTGNSSGPHIHFEIRQNAFQDDPCWFLGC